VAGNSDNLEQVRRDLAQIKRERRAEIRAERRNRFLCEIGHVTRPMVYLVPMEAARLLAAANERALADKAKALADKVDRRTVQ